MEEKFKLFCFGFGQVAKYFVKNLMEKKLNFYFVATNTTKTQLKEFCNFKYKPYCLFDDKFDDDLFNDLNSLNKILISIPPKNKESYCLVLYIFFLNRVF